MNLRNDIAANGRVAAVVVSYNRKDLLRRVLEGVYSQTRAVDEVIVIDNGSNDGSREMLADAFPNAVVIASTNNCGGAGGFAKGLSWAAQSYDYAWLMDDDAIPMASCLELLLEPFARYGKDQVAFTCPQVTDESGNTGPRNFPVPATNFKDIYKMAADSWIPVSAATFVGPLINIELAKRTHAPLEDFFIWHDDFEYTSRLACLGAGVSVPAAHIMHLAANPGPNHYNAARNHEHVRNLVWWWRELRKTDASAHRRLGVRIVMSIRHQFLLAPNKFQYLAVIFGAIKAATVKHPRHRVFLDIYTSIINDDSVRRGALLMTHA